MDDMEKVEQVLRQVVCTVLGVWLTSKLYGASYRTSKEAARTAVGVWDEITKTVKEKP